MTLRYKLTEDEKAIPINENGFPVIIDDEKDPQEEIGVDVLDLYQAVPRLKAEAANYRKERNTLKDNLKIFEEAEIKPEDLPEWFKNAQEALTTVQNFKDGDLVKADKVESIKKQAKEDLQKSIDDLNAKYQQETQELQKSVDDKDIKIRKLMIDDQFSQSKFVDEKLSLTAKVARAYFQDNFKVEETEGGNGALQVVGYFNDGEKILDSAKNYEVADFDNALKRLVDKDQDRDNLLVGSTGAGTGAESSQGRSGIKKNPFKRESEDWNLTEQSRVFKEDPALAEQLMKEAGVSTEA